MNVAKVLEWKVQRSGMRVSFKTTFWGKRDGKVSRWLTSIMMLRENSIKVFESNNGIIVNSSDVCTKMEMFRSTK